MYKFNLPLSVTTFATLRDHYKHKELNSIEILERHVRNAFVGDIKERMAALTVAIIEALSETGSWEPYRQRRLEVYRYYLQIMVEYG